MRYGLGILAAVCLMQAPAGAENVAPTGAPTSSVGAFRWQAERVRAGTVYHYTKSNVDGSNPAEVHFYLPNAETIEVLKVEAGGRYLAYVKAKLDPATLSLREIESYNQLERGKRNLQAAMTLDAKTHTYTAKILAARCPAKVGHYPVHVYNFDFISLNVIFPLLIDPTKDLEIGVLDPNWAYIASEKFTPQGEHPEAFRYKGKARIHYVGEEARHGAACRKYSVGGPGLDDKEGTLWVNKATGRFEDFEHPLPDNPDWDSFKFELKKASAMTPAKWAAFLDETTKRAAAMGKEPATKAQ